MPSFEDMQKLYQNVGTHGQQLKAMADMVVQQTFDNDIGTKQCYIYDYFHDDQPDLEWGYNPALSKTKIPVKLKFIIKSYKSMAKDEPEYHIMFEPDVWNSMSCKPDWFINNYERLGVEFPNGLYCDIPDDRGVYHKWMFTYNEVANQFPKLGLIRCNYLFTWIKDDGIHRYKRKIWGTERTQNSYTSGTWMGDKFNLLDEQGKFFIPWNTVSAEIKHDMRFFISMLQDEPYVYKSSKIKNTSPKGIIAVTVEQDRFDKNKDYVDNNPSSPTYGEMYADYYSSTIIPEEIEPESEIDTVTDILTIEAKTYKVRINGGSKVVYAKILDEDGKDVTSNYYSEILNWKFYIGDQELDNTLIKLDNTYNTSSNNICKYKFYFLGSEDFLNEKLTIKLKINELSASAELDIVS